MRTELLANLAFILGLRKVSQEGEHTHTHSAHSRKPLSSYELGAVLSLGIHHFPQLSSYMGLDPAEAPITLEYISTLPPPNQCA